MRVLFAVLVIALSFLLSLPCQRAYAADILYRLTHGDQDALVVGVVSAVGDNTLVLDPVHTIAGLPTRPPAVLTLKDNTADMQPAVLKTGDIVVASVTGSGSTLKERWGVFKATSLDHRSLLITSGPLTGAELAAFQRYINSNGRDSEFVLKDGRAYVRHGDGSLEALTPVAIQQTSPVSYSPTPRSDADTAAANGWNTSFLAGAAAVLIVLLLLFRFRPRPPYPKEGP